MIKYNDSLKRMYGFGNKEIGYKIYLDMNDEKYKIYKEENNLEEKIVATFETKEDAEEFGIFILSFMKTQ